MMGYAPGCVWLMVNSAGVYCSVPESSAPSSGYVRADLYDAANQNEADAIAAYGDLMIKFAALERENERLRAAAAGNYMHNGPSTEQAFTGHVYTPWGYAK